MKPMTLLTRTSLLIEALGVIVSMALAMAKSNNVEQKSLLLESLDFLKKAR